MEAGGHGLELVKGLAAGLAVLLVGVGWSRKLHERWLLARHRAERLRPLRYQLLVDSRAWSSDASRTSAVEREFRESFSRIRRMGPLQMEDWASASWQFLAPDDPEVPDGGVEGWFEAVDHYRMRRLGPQLAYFRAAARRSERWGEFTEAFILTSFFGGVLLELGAVGAAALGAGEHAARWLLFLGLLLPVLAAAARIVRSAFEFGRNEDRCRAAAASLERCHGQLDATRDGALTRRFLWAAEQVLEAEHREWLRLMIKAPWFG